MHYEENLRLLDNQLRRVYEHLEATRRLDRTILVFAGDHGESFGQHPGMWTHTFGTFNESYKTPLIFFQPKLFRPQTITFPTAHADVLPTLLDSMGVAYNSRLIQGESLLREIARKSIFTVSGLGDYLTSIGPDSIKVSVSFGKEDSYVFDLERDPLEKHPLPAERFADELTALLKFRNYQLKIIPAYNAAVRQGAGFHGGSPNQVTARSTTAACLPGVLARRCRRALPRLIDRPDPIFAACR